MALAEPCEVDQCIGDEGGRHQTECRQPGAERREGAQREGRRDGERDEQSGQRAAWAQPVRVCRPKSQEGGTLHDGIARVEEHGELEERLEVQPGRRERDERCIGQDGEVGRAECRVEAREGGREHAELCHGDEGPRGGQHQRAQHSNLRRDRRGEQQVLESLPAKAATEDFKLALAPLEPARRRHRRRARHERHEVAQCGEQQCEGEGTGVGARRVVHLRGDHPRRVVAARVPQHEREEEVPLRRRRRWRLDRRVKRLQRRRVFGTIRGDDERDDGWGHEGSEDDGTHTNDARAEKIDASSEEDEEEAKEGADDVGSEAPPAGTDAAMRLRRHQRQHRSLHILREEQRVQCAVEDVAQQVGGAVEEGGHRPEGVVHPDDVPAAVRHRHRELGGDHCHWRRPADRRARQRGDGQQRPAGRDGLLDAKS
mmetsp:Transcript_983/g.2684  ORF Transcript_983/g.2684 Transcript_983/m.2684 type:complete len:428 (-) Transcript_983:79-1362(-)